MAIKKHFAAAMVVVTMAMSAALGYFGRTYLDDDLVSKIWLLSEGSPVMVFPKEAVMELGNYVENLERAVTLCQAGNSV